MDVFVLTKYIHKKGNTTYPSYQILTVKVTNTMNCTYNVRRAGYT